MKLSAAVAVILCAFTAPASAQQPHDHAAMARVADASVPQEMGQSAFAAIQEIVRMLQADVMTDWSRVNIDALRAHLVDMDNVVLHADVSTTVAGSVVTFDVSGEGAVRESIRRMIFAQAATAHGDAAWTYTARQTDRGASLAIETRDGASAAKLKALGYFGLVSQGPHHQVHHMMIARGRPPH